MTAYEMFLPSPSNPAWYDQSRDRMGAVSRANPVSVRRVLAPSYIFEPWKSARAKARGSVLFVLFLVALPSVAPAQISSIGLKQRRVNVSKPEEHIPRERRVRQYNRVYEQHSWITVRPAQPKKFKPGDLITVIVRQQRRYEADSELQTKKRYRIETELDAFLKLTKGGIGAATFRRGKPNVSYEVDHQLKSTGDASREDRLTTRLTATIIDIKPNGMLVLEGRAQLQHDDEWSGITITGSCRKEDVTTDNTILSTQMAGLTISVENEGALRDASTRGWLHRLVDLIKPF